MKLRLDYFREEQARQSRQDGLHWYTHKMNKLAKDNPDGTVIKIGKDRGLVTRYGIFRVGHGNSKVHFPTVNFESGLTCSSADICPFSFQSKRKDKESTAPLCYAQKMEGAFRGTLNAKTYQAQVVEKIARYATFGYEMLIAEEIADMVKDMGKRHVRVSETGDIGPKVSPFAQKVLDAMVVKGLKPYLYTKRPDIEREALEATGAVVLVSERDFVCVKSEAEAKKLSLPVCPGQCGGPGGCYRCPLGKQTAVIAH